MKETGGPAYPSTNDVKFPGGGTSGHPGMTLRDYFAGQSLPKVSAMFPSEPEREQAEAARIAMRTYLIADAMLAERNK